MFCPRRPALKLIRDYSKYERQMQSRYLPLLHKLSVLKSLESKRVISSSSLRFCEDSKGPPRSPMQTDAVKDKPTKESKYREKYDNPVTRTFGIMGDDLKEYFSTIKNSKVRKAFNLSGSLDSQAQCDGNSVEQPDGDNSRTKSDVREVWPSTCDVLVIGGGAIGSSIAYHLKERALQGLHVVVVEQDSTYQKSSTVLSVGGIRQQFSLPENIQLSMYGMQFLRKAPELLAVEGADVPDMQFNPNGYLTLASEAGVQDLMENFSIQREVGAKVEFLSSTKLKKRFPWMNTEGIEAGVLGLENEGWFDPWSLLTCLRRKAVSLGAEYVNGKLTGLNCNIIEDVITEGIGNMSIKNVNTAEISLPDGEKREIAFSILVVAAGAWSGEVGRLLGIGDGSGIMKVPIPVEPRKRYVYCIHAPDGPGLDCPLVIDPNGTYFRREGLGGLYLCGQSPDEEGEPPIDNLEVDEMFFENNVWPTIASRVPTFENAKLRSSWGGYYDYNTYDQNGIIGLHPLFSNMFIAAGFSGHGIQQSPAVGRAIMECILHGEFNTINLERFGFERFLIGEPLHERNIV